MRCGCLSLRWFIIPHNKSLRGFSSLNFVLGTACSGCAGRSHYFMSYSIHRNLILDISGSLMSTKLVQQGLPSDPLREMKALHQATKTCVVISNISACFHLFPVLTRTHHSHAYSWLIYCFGNMALSLIVYLCVSP